MARNTLSRSLHDLGLAAWFGGTLANAVALNPASAHAGDARSVSAVSNEGWDRWTPVNAAAIGAHLIGSIGQLRANAGRVRSEHGVAGMSTMKTVLTVAALGVTGYSRLLGQQVSAAGNPSASGTKPKRRSKVSKKATRDAAAAQEQLDTLQWVIPALTGALVVVSSFAGEQQRPRPTNVVLGARTTV